MLTLSADILANNPKIQGDEYEIKDCSAVVQSVLYWQQQLELAKGKKTGEHKRQVLVPEELSETAKRWSLPMIKTKNSSGVQIEAMLEEGEKPIWDSNFKANGYKLYDSGIIWGGWSKRYCNWAVGGYCGIKDRPKAWNLNYDSKQLKLNGVDNLPESFSIGWTQEQYITGWWKKVERDKWCGGGDSSDYICGTEFVEVKATKDKVGAYPKYATRTVGLNNPLYADSKISMAYSITLPQPIVIKPTKIDMNENITNVKDDDSFFYKKITQNIIDPNSPTKECVRYPESEFVLDSNGKKQCVGGEESIDTEEKVVNGKKEIVKKYDSEGNPICKSGIEYQKHKDWNEAKKGQCKTQDIRLFTTGVTFTPNYDESPIDMSKQYCKAGETQSFETIEEKTYKMPDDDDDDKQPYETDENGNPIEMADGESSYYKYIQQHRDNAMNVNNYSKTIKEVICIADYDDTNMNAYVAGGVINHYKNYELTKLEVESLTNMSIWVGGRGNWKEKEKCGKGDVAKMCRRVYREQILYTTFNTKKNWANNQTIYEHEMYRPFRRPDGSVFYLYERQGFFSNPQSVDCADCARDDELNG